MLVILNFLLAQVLSQSFVFGQTCACILLDFAVSIICQINNMRARI